MPEKLSLAPSEAAKAYILVYLPFYARQRLHPYVREVTKTKRISHSEIETDLNVLLDAGKSSKPPLF